MRGFVAIAVIAVALGAASASSASGPSLQFSRNLVNVGKIHLTEAADFDVILTNVGSEPLTLTTAEITPNPNTFLSPSNCAIGSTLGVGQSCLFEVNVAGNEIGQIKGEFCWTGVGATITDRQCGRVTGKVVA
jgi:HYDIN/CFA65/VesB-like, Ig-like domain